MATWLTLREAGDYARISEQMIAKAVRAGALPAYTIGSGAQYRLRAEDIDEWMMSRSWEPPRYRSKHLDPQPLEHDLDAPAAAKGSRGGWVPGQPRLQHLPAEPDDGESTPGPTTAPLPEAASYKKVKPESRAIIFNMPELSEAQTKLLNRVRREREVVLDNSYRAVVESLVRRNLLTYHVTGNRRAYQFTVRPTRA